MNDFLVRAAIESDACWVQALATQADLEVDLSSLLFTPHARVYVLDPCAGFLSVWIVQDEMQVQDIAVAPTFRGRGVGRALFQAALTVARTEGVRLVTLEVRESNQDALAFYGALGFGQVGRRPRYYSNGEAALLLSRVLTEVS